MASPPTQFRTLAGARQFRRKRRPKDQPRRIEYRGMIAKLGALALRENRMSNRLQGKVALVTAAGQGIGRAIPEAFIAEGAKVVATDVAEEKVQDVKAAKPLKLDVRAQDSIDAVAKTVA